MNADNYEDSPNVYGEHKMTNTPETLAGALAKAQAAMTSAKFNKVNPHFKSKYADLASIIDAVRKPLTDNGLSVTQATAINGNGFVLRTELHHINGQSVISEYPLPANATPQQMGSALTYARRYTLSAIVCIAADEDDDANAANEVVPATITKAQYEELMKLAETAGADLEKFKKYMGISDLEKMPLTKYSQAVDALANKAGKK